MIKRFILLSFLTFISFQSFSNQSKHLIELSKSRTWLQLLTYYERNSALVTDKSFFLSDSGHENPFNELNATLAAFSDNTYGDINQHAQCRFPARFSWLKKQIDLNEFDIKELTCPDYIDFAQPQKNKPISVVFATGYLGNPASYYGHLLLKFSDDILTDLRQTSINYGADIPSGEGMLSYIVKGILGGYDSSFTSQEFFYHYNNYNETEFRDLWEFKLNLSDENAQFVKAHIWELLAKDFDYYFFNRNCAYFMAKALELVLDEPIVSDNKLWIAPQEVVQGLNKSIKNGRSVIAGTKYYPSRQSRFYQRFANLTSSEKSKLIELIYKPESIASETLSAFTIQSKLRIADVLIDYYQFVRVEKDKSKDPNNLNYQRAVQLRYRLPIGSSWKAFVSNNIPALGRGVSRSWYGVEVTEKTQISLGLRPAYYDVLDATFGHVGHSSLSMGEFSLGIDKSGIFISKLDLVKIESIKRNYTQLPGDKNHSWFLEVGAREKNLTCRNCIVPFAQSGFGYSHAFSIADLTASVFFTGGFHGNTVSEELFFIGGRASISWYLSDLVQVASNMQFNQFFASENEIEIQSRLRFKIGESYDLRFEHQFDEQDSYHSFGISIGHYW